MEWELLDWDVLHGSETKSTDSVTSDKKSGSSSVIDDGMSLSDHFSVDNLIKGSDLCQYGSEPPTQMHNPGEIQVDLLSGHLDVFRSSDDAGDGLVRVSYIEAPDFEGVAGVTGGTVSLYEDASKCLPKSDDLQVANERYVEDSLSDSGGNVLEVSGDFGDVNCEAENVSENGVASSEAIEESGGNTVNSAVRSGDESKGRETVWYKMPFVLLKYYAFRIGPVWSVSMAAAVMGLVLLGRRLYNMKRKAQRFHLKVTIDEKKVSRVMNQAARLNEMFREVKRVPVIRPALPSPGGAWPVLSLR